MSYSKTVKTLLLTGCIQCILFTSMIAQTAQSNPTALDDAANNQTSGLLLTGNVGIGINTPTFFFEVANNGETDGTADAMINDIRFGKGVGNVASNLVVGIDAFLNNTTGVGNTAVGRNTLQANTTGNVNNAFGDNSLLSNTTGNFNSAIGNGILRNNTTGSFNIGLGFRSLLSNIDGLENVSIGHDAMRSNVSGSQNIAIGRGSLLFNLTGNSNIALGKRSIRRITSGNKNIGIGENVIDDLLTGSNNLVIGMNSGQGITTGSSNVIIGSNFSLFATDMTKEIVIGDGAGNRRINIDSFRNVGIGLIDPEATLDIEGNLIIREVDNSVNSSDEILLYNGSSSEITKGTTIAEIQTSTPLTNTSTDITLMSSGGTVLADASSASITINLPSSHSSGKIYRIKKIDGSLNGVSINGNGNTIDGSPSFNISTQYEVIVLQSDGINWFIIN